MSDRPETPGPRLLFIVARTETKLHWYAQSSFADAQSIQVVLDRRQGERRRAGAPPSVERRHSDRRQFDVNDRLQRVGWAVVHREAAPTAPVKA